jgi:hypothetical protein
VGLLADVRVERSIASYVAEYKRERALPAAAAVFQALWRGREARDRFRRHMALRNGALTRLLRSYLRAWAQGTVLPRRMRRVELRRAFAAWRGYVAAFHRLMLLTVRALGSQVQIQRLGQATAWRLRVGYSPTKPWTGEYTGVGAVLGGLLYRRYPAWVKRRVVRGWAAEAKRAGELRAAVIKAFRGDDMDSRIRLRTRALKCARARARWRIAADAAAGVHCCRRRRCRRHAASPLPLSPAVGWERALRSV